MCPSGARGGRSAPAARRGRMKGGQHAQAVGEAAKRHVGREEGGAGLQQAREAAGGGGSRVRGRDRGDRGPEEEDEDRFAKSQKCRDLTVMS
jgi:hypothetical protein